MILETLFNSRRDYVFPVDKAGGSVEAGGNKNVKRKK
jgi:hypothetical protein